MRIPKVEHIDSGSEKIKHIHIEKPIIIPRLPVITNSKQRVKLVKSIERYIRNSLEYRDLISYLKEYMDMTSCEFFPNFKQKKKKGVIEIHHEPYDLFKITDIVCRKHEKEYGYIDELAVADEVMYCHYTGLVGLIPLSITAHELTHNGKLIIPLNCVFGNFVKFTKQYYDYLDEDDSETTINILREKMELTKKLSSADMSILEVRYVYTDVDGCILPKIVDDDN